MNKNTFLNYFLLNKQRISHSAPQQPLDTNQFRKAAVLILIVERRDGLHIIFTQRALHLRNHPGQISFPGGKYETFDRDLKKTALRETLEEIGIPANKITVLGSLPKLSTTSGFLISPYLGFVSPDHRLKLDEQEVKCSFEVPLDFLLDANNFHAKNITRKQKQRFVYLLPYQNRMIWGATAQILKNLQQQIAVN